MSQTRKESLIEITVDMVLGFIISVFSYMAILPMFGFSISLAANLSLTIYFVVISYIRRYFTRRWFNAHDRKSK